MKVDFFKRSTKLADPKLDLKKKKGKKKENTQIN